MRAGRIFAVCLFLVAFRAAPAQTGDPEQGFRIAGRVVNAETGTPLAAAQVSIETTDDNREQPPARAHHRQPSFSSSGALQSVTTAADGTFRFEHVPAGKYSLSGMRRGFVTANYEEHGLYSTAIVTGEGLDSEGLTLKLSPGAVIAGTVTDNSGDPVEQANVSLYRQQDDGLGNIRMSGGTQTNDLGGYEFTHLEPGTYFVSATGRPWYAMPAPAQEDQGAGIRPVPSVSTNLDVVYLRSFYADATDSAGATPIPVRGGEQLRINLHMNAVPAVHLSVPMGSNGDDANRGDGGMPAGEGQQPPFRLPVLQQMVFGELDSSGGVTGQVAFRGETGHQIVTMSVAPGEYQLEDGGRTMAVNATGDAQVNAQSGTPSVDVTGRVGPAEGVELPGSLSLTLYPAEGRTSGTLIANEHDGSFTFEQVPPGDYELEARADGRILTVVQIAASGAELSGHVLKVGARPVAFAATLAPASSVVAGIAQADGRPASGAMIVLVPEHPGDHSLYRRDQSDSDGSFSLREVAAGNYTLVAIRDGWDLDWAKPEVIAHYLPGGEPVTVTGATTPTIRPAKPITVQSR